MNLHEERGTRNRWKTTKSAEIPCGNCGTRGTCTVSPDGTAFKCWRDGGKVHQTNGHAGSNGHGTGYVGAAHRKPAKLHATHHAAITAAGLLVENGKLAGTWTYRDAAGDEVMLVARFDLDDGGKEFRPVHRSKGGWKVGDPQGSLPLFRLNELPAAGPIIVCEGEKAADAARLIGLPATTSSHGSSSAARSDWTPLAGRLVIIFPDHDEAGRKYARDVARIAAKLDPPAQVKIVELPGLPAGGDMVEFLEARDSRDTESILVEVGKLADATPLINPAELTGGPLTTCLADVEPCDVAWLWEGRIPLGRLTLLVGRPGEGKSFLTTDAAARVTTGTPWPDGTPCPKGSVILICAEDDPADTIRPRLDAHHADCRRVHLLTMVRRISEDGKPHDFMFTLADVASLETVLRQLTDCRLIVIDPIGSFIGGKVDGNAENEVRSILAPVAMLAERHDAAVLVVAHRRKSTAAAADDLALGSRAFTGIARAVWHLSRDGENKSRRLLLPGKNNLAREGDGLAFTIGGEPPCISWERDPVRMNADEGLAAENAVNKPGPEPEARSQAADWLLALLGDGEIAAAVVKSEAANAGLSYRTVQRAADTLGVIREKNAFSGGWQWRLPRPADEGDK